MRFTLNVDEFLDSKQQQLLLELGKLKGLYGALFMLYAVFLLYFHGPMFFIVLKLIMAGGLILLYFNSTNNVLLELGVLFTLSLEIYIYVWFIYSQFPTSILWVLVLPNYVFLLKKNRSKILFIFLLILPLIIGMLFSNIFSFHFEFGDNQLNIHTFNIINVLFILLINYLIFNKYITIHGLNLEKIKNKNAELIKTRNELIKSQNFQEEFFANVSHEIRTPMTAITGAIDLLRHEKININLSHTLEDSCNSLTILINEFLDYNKAAQNDIIFSDFEFNIRERLKKLNSVFSFQLKEYNINLQIEVSDDIPDLLIGDARRLIQILLNIIGNCIKNSGNGVITVKLQPLKIDSEVIVIQFSINHMGEKITLDQNNQNNYNLNLHSVLSLDWTKKIIECNEGLFHVETYSQDVKQYKIELEFKLPQSQDSTNFNDKISDDMSNENLKILIVDDNKINLTISQKQINLYEKNYEIDTALNGEECLEKCNEKKYDILLLDIRMPKISGIEVSQRLRGNAENLNHQTPIIALTADVTEKTMNECFSVGINRVISKPYDIKHLLEALKNLVHAEKK